jgi:cephalosporin hydroxylase
MRITLDTDKGVLIQEEGGRKTRFDLYSNEAFELLSKAWLKVGWNQRYTYTFSWLGRPVIQLPEDLIRYQETIWKLKPDLIIETGVCHGGSLIFSASMCKLIGKGRVIGIDIDIRPHNRKALEEHELFSYMTLIQGSSIDPKIVQQVKDQVNKGDKVLILLDSNHTKLHVMHELNAYAPLVTQDSYIIVADGLMEDLYDTPRGKEEWKEDNPKAAVLEFVQSHPEFELQEPAWPFNESPLNKNITHWPGAWLKRK